MAYERLNPVRVHPSIKQQYEGFHADIVAEVKTTVDREALVVVGMRTNPVVKKIRKAFAAAGIAYTYLEYGSYLSMWKQRLAIKIWSGWPTFPQVFAHGQLLGGAADVIKLIESGELSQLLQRGRP